MYNYSLYTKGTTMDEVFHLKAPFQPTGDQPQAIEALMQDTDATMMTLRRSDSAAVAEWRRRSISSLMALSFSI